MGTTGCVSFSRIDEFLVYNDISSYSKSLHKDKIYLDFFEEVETNDLSLSYTIDPTSSKQVTLEEARVCSVNLYLDALNYINTNKRYLKFKKGKLVPLDTFSINLSFGNKFSSDYVFTGLEDVKMLVIRRDETLNYYIPKHPNEYYIETLVEAIDILKEKDQIENPEHLKWLEKVPSELSKDINRG